MGADRRTSLHPRHLGLGAKMGAFAGWDMPLTYGSPREEHLAVRRDVGVFDVSHMGQLQLAGPGAHAYLNRRLSNDLGRLEEGQGQYSLLLVPAGGIVDDLIVYRLADRYLAVVNAANTEACRTALLDGLPADVELSDRSADMAMLALQGPAWAECLGPVGDAEGTIAAPYFSIVDAEIAGVPCRVARTGYTGEPGAELLVPWDEAPRVWDALTKTSPRPARPAGLVARDTLRLEVGYPLHGNELSLERTPIEAALRFACDLEHGGFVGADVVLRQAAEGTEERLAAFELTEPGIPRAGQRVLAGEEVVGTVTSGTLSPVLERGIGMAYLAADYAAAGTEIAVDVRGSRKSAVTARRPLVDTSPTKG